MQPATDDPATDDQPPLSICVAAAHLLDHTNLATLGPDILTARLRLLGKQRRVVSDLGGRIAAVLLTRDGKTQRGLADDTGIPKSTIDRWVAPYRAGAA